MKNDLKIEFESQKTFLKRKNMEFIASYITRFPNEIKEMSSLMIGDLSAYQIYMLLKNNKEIVQRICEIHNYIRYDKPVHSGYYINIDDKRATMSWINNCSISWIPSSYYLIKQTKTIPYISNISFVPKLDKILSIDCIDSVDIKKCSDIIIGWDL